MLLSKEAQLGIQIVILSRDLVPSTSNWSRYFSPRTVFLSVFLTASLPS